jgi:hypothetical protein
MPNLVPFGKTDGYQPGAEQKARSIGVSNGSETAQGGSHHRQSDKPYGALH